MSAKNAVAQGRLKMSNEWKRLDLTDMPKDLTVCEFRKNHGISKCDMHWQDALVDMPDERIEYRIKPKKRTLNHIQEELTNNHEEGREFLPVSERIAYYIGVGDGFKAGRSDEYSDVEV
jgi:hypothetical protein